MCYCRHAFFSPEQQQTLATRKTSRLMVKLSLIFLFLHCSSLHTTSASSQWMVCPVPATCTASPLLLSAFLTAHLSSVIHCFNVLPVSLSYTFTWNVVHNSLGVVGIWEVLTFVRWHLREWVALST